MSYNDPVPCLRGTLIEYPPLMKFGKGPVHMSCLRCGRETSQQQVFCENCLEDMSRHPVKPDVAIYLPVRKPKEAPRKQSRHRKKEPSAEELVVALRKRVRFLAVTAVILVCMLAAAAVGVWMANRQSKDISIPNIGQNYQTAEPNNSNSVGD